MNEWSNLEVELIVTDYFSMLYKELTGQDFKKTEHRRSLLPQLNNRSEGSIEFKHQNISAVLINFGQPYIKGYLPRYNYQKILEDKVIEYLYNHKSIEKQFKDFADGDIVQINTSKDFTTLIVDPPEINLNFEEPKSIYSKSPIKTNYLEKEQRNLRLGLMGEEFVLEYERWRLKSSGNENLANQVRWISNEEGDGAGFDILSKNQNGTDKYIEVKTTKLGKDTPFFFTRNELQFSTHNSKDYHLYRLFNFEKKAKMFIKNGGLDTICSYVPISFKGQF
ncbi:MULTISPECIES: DUF3883 domain-containing protein [Maribacter]|uniref:DUF3883 domain-containing protein n=1 Tax=Maribacter flavus TaxID=1658664 RepID=A0ABU7IKD2_9FLAO|nr:MULTISPECIES: DUF3883 domain-containing protein [Maribacter]MDC6406285.1 DUF3883 domain-containing protein [Maribacter sp. PR66]MEE1973405.1 DUF3883 domain-containing protein [Maribacter flavus]